MKAKKNLQDLSYREKLLKLSRLYSIQEIQKKISNSRLTNKQIESLLKKNNVLLPKNLINKKLNFIYWTNFYKVLAESALRAIRNPLCQPLRVPTTGYERWKDLQLNFDANEMLEG